MTRPKDFFGAAERGSGRRRVCEVAASEPPLREREEIQAAAIDAEGGDGALGYSLRMREGGRKGERVCLNHSTNSLEKSGEIERER